MSDLHTSAPPAARATRPTTRRTVLRWMVSFAGYPLGGVAAMTIAGPVDGLRAAIVGGFCTGAVLGAVQAWAMGPNRPSPLAWVAATAVGLMAGLGLGAWLVDYQTGARDLVVQGAVSGALVGVAQAAVLVRRLGAIALAWPVALGVVWAVGWAITTSIGVQVDDQFTVFGSSGALVATLLTAVLPLVLNNRPHPERSAS